MQALDLNLASRPFKNNTLLWVGFSAATLLLLYVSWDNVATRQRHLDMRLELEGRVGGIEARQQELRRRADQALRQIGTYDVESLAVRAGKANEVIRWKAFSWTGLFNQLEEVLPWDVQMASIHPSFRPEGDRSGRDEIVSTAVPVAVDGTARNLPAFLDLERQLILSPYFARVEPERTEIDPQTHETVFGLRFYYNPEIPAGPPPAPEEPAAEAAEAPVAPVVEPRDDGVENGERGSAPGEAGSAEPAEGAVTPPPIEIEDPFDALPDAAATVEPPGGAEPQGAGAGPAPEPGAEAAGGDQAAGAPAEPPLEESPSERLQRAAPPPAPPEAAAEQPPADDLPRIRRVRKPSTRGTGNRSGRGGKKNAEDDGN